MNRIEVSKCVVCGVKITPRRNGFIPIKTCGKKECLKKSRGMK